MLLLFTISIVLLDKKHKNDKNQANNLQLLFAITSASFPLVSYMAPFRTTGGQ